MYWNINIEVVFQKGKEVNVNKITINLNFIDRRSILTVVNTRILLEDKGREVFWEKHINNIEDNKKDNLGDNNVQQEGIIFIWTNYNLI